MQTNELVRVELIFSQAVEEDFFDSFRKEKIVFNYTKIDNVTGSGYSNPKLGDAIWPQLNEIMVIYCSEAEAEKIIEVVERLRRHYPAEGIACFTSEAQCR